jgi:hypothetical protein
MISMMPWSQMYHGDAVLHETHRPGAGQRLAEHGTTWFHDEGVNASDILDNFPINLSQAANHAAGQK